MAYTRPFRLRHGMMVLVLALVALLVIQPMLVAAKKGNDEKKKDDEVSKSGKGKGKVVDDDEKGGDEGGAGEGEEEGGEAGEDKDAKGGAADGKEGGAADGNEGGADIGNEEVGAGEETETGNQDEGAGGKPDCQKGGSMCGDPKIIGGDGVTFYFHGRKDQGFCLVSDNDIHINSHFIGKRPKGRNRDFTWVQALGFVFGQHTLIIAANPVTVWDSKIDHLEFSYNGIPFSLDLPSWRFPAGAFKLNRIGATNAVDLVVKEKMGVSLTVIPITAEENRVHKYGITDDDCFAHFDMQFRFYNLSYAVNGVLGQKNQPGFVNLVKRGVAMPIMGGADRFLTSSLQDEPIYWHRHPCWFRQAQL